MRSDKLDKLKEKACSNPKKIILPESYEPRIIKAAKRVIDEGIAELVFLGDKKKLEKRASEFSLDLSNIEIVDYLKSDDFDRFSEKYYQLRKHSGVTRQQAQSIIKNPIFYAAMMLREDKVDGFVAGSINTSGDVAKAALHCLGVDKNIGTVSSAFLILVPDCKYGEDGLFIFADCGVVPNPSSKQLSNIAISTADMTRQVLSIEPKIAMLSYSTHSSAEGHLIDKVTEATEIVRQKRPDILIDGELQVDAALVPEVAKLKSPESKLAGSANVLIFPNLEAGNISYKLVQRLAKARAVGPLLQGLNKPCSDLSRGCSTEDVVDAIIVTVIRAQKNT
jgi:phosphate acetyltransferase